MASLFEINRTDPINKLPVKNIYVKKISKKTGKEIWHMKWQYYRHRKTLSVTNFYKSIPGEEVRITFSGVPQQKVMIVPKFNKSTGEFITSEVLNTPENQETLENQEIKES